MPTTCQTPAITECGMIGTCTNCQTQPMPNPAPPPQAWPSFARQGMAGACWCCVLTENGIFPKVRWSRMKRRSRPSSAKPEKKPQSPRRNLWPASTDLRAPRANPAVPLHDMGSWPTIHFRQVLRCRPCLFASQATCEMASAEAPSSLLTGCQLVPVAKSKHMF